jgi:hypothetical protein
MIRRLSLATLVPFALLLVAAFPLMAASPLVDPPPVDVPAALSHKEAMVILRKTLISRDWILIKESANEVEGKLNVRAHSITVRYSLEGKTIRFKYLDSVNMDYKLDRRGNPVIHRKYAGWMSNVAVALNREFQMATLSKAAG